MGRIEATSMRAKHTYLLAKLDLQNAITKSPIPINLHPACHINIQETVGCSPQRRTTELSSGVRISLQQTLGRHWINRTEVPKFT